MRRFLAPDLPAVLTPPALVGAFFAIVLAAISENDGWLFGAAIGLVVDAFITRVRDGLREG